MSDPATTVDMAPQERRSTVPNFTTGGVEFECWWNVVDARYVWRSTCSRIETYCVLRRMEPIRNAGGEIIDKRDASRFAARLDGVLLGDGYTSGTAAKRAAVAEMVLRDNGRRAA